MKWIAASYRVNMIHIRSHNYMYTLRDTTNLIIGFDQTMRSYTIIGYLISSEIQIFQISGFSLSN